jgi:holo-[acyl-carrier protein] synthase
MILGVGIDLVMISEIQQQIDEIEHYISEVFTKSEIEYCSKQGNPYALGTGWTKEIDFQEIEVVREEGNRPTLRLSATALASLLIPRTFTAHVSLSHTDSVATAVVVLDN